MPGAVSPRLARLFWFWILLWTTCVAGGLVNRTIDDQFGDSSTGFHPSYSPDDGWAQGAQCTSCHLNAASIVDVTQTYDYTWHDSTYIVGGPEHTITFGFNGTAVYVYHLLAGHYNYTITFTNLTFFLDDQHVGQFVRPPDNTSHILYNVLVFHQTNLSHQPHSFKTVTNGPSNALILFDYAIYTTELEEVPATSSASSQRAPSTSVTSTSLSATQTSSHASSSTSVGAIVGGTVGGVAVLAAVGVLFFCLLGRRRPVRPPSVAERVEPFATDAGEGAIEDPSSRQTLHLPGLADSHLGRSRLMLGAGWSTTASSTGAGEC